MNLIKFTVVAIALLSATISVNAQFAYNAEENGNNESSKIIYRVDKSGKYLFRHLKYNFVYDEQNRPVEKEALKWNDDKQKWEPYYRLYYQYNSAEMGCNVEYARWDGRTNSYSDSLEKAEYLSVNGKLLSYQSYKRDERTKDWNLVLNHEVMGIFASLK